jgi:hypothetical protein
LARKGTDDDDVYIDALERADENNVKRNRLLEESIRVQKTVAATKIMVRDPSLVANAENRRWLENLQSSIRDGSFFLPTNTTTATSTTSSPTSDNSPNDNSPNDPTSDIE